MMTEMYASRRARGARPEGGLTAQVWCGAAALGLRSACDEAVAAALPSSKSTALPDLQTSNLKPHAPQDMELAVMRALEQSV